MHKEASSVRVSPNATCVLSSEGSFEERRHRLDWHLQRIVCTRGFCMLPADYIDKMFPEKDPPKPERKAPVFLNELLTPPDPPKSSGSRPSTASTGFPGWGSSQDPAVLAAMMVQAAMMKSSPPVPPMAGTMPYAGQMPPACFRPPFGQVPADAYPATLQTPKSDASEEKGPPQAALKVGLGESLPPMRPPKPSIQAQRTSNAHSISTRERGSEVPPFVMLLEGFCERMLYDRPRQVTQSTTTSRR
ncbi:unnamed protein product [Durusdinium trenchii]|uniref:Uncharacterized protein n=1 Tax=Durusdinium trenchii TaxID=1381693 RepID=A0ABP0JA64_9DINO